MSDAERICRAYHVPYWVAGFGPKPSWLRRPFWRYWAWRWSR